MEKTLDELIEEEKNIDINLFQDELRKYGTLLRSSSDDRYEIWTFESKNSAFLMDYVGLTREIAFRKSKGGSGKDKDIDKHDNIFKQLIVVNKKTSKLDGGYRYAEGKELIDEKGTVVSPTAHLFNMSPEFIQDYLPNSIELGRSYSSSSKALKALIDGLGVIVINSDAKYLFGKITRFPHEDNNENIKIRSHIQYFLDLYHKDEKQLLVPRTKEELLDYRNIEEHYKGDDYEADFKSMVKNIGGYRNLPPMLTVYLKLSSRFKQYGSAVNDNFGNVEETAILVNTKEFEKSAIKDHILSHNDTTKIREKFNYVE